ncbi:LLM class flavin-dependent oxidoreductase [Dactylosporangium sp. CA-139066]|uniref:LLM class flavin-dependent oxidoreductase n=1 Tax=Dactylosporangium sp. CA-139066 TaxID=3239930 RepID=UPI003D91C0D4
MTEPNTPRRLRVGMSLSAHYNPGESVSDGLRDTMEQVAVAEEEGLDSILLGHHYLTRSQFLQPMSTVGYLAARTERIRLGFGVYLVPLHNPLALAEEFLTLDQLSGGRLILGLGSGYRSVEFRAFGIPVEERFKRFEEHVRVLRDLLRGREVTASGAFGELDGARILLPPVDPAGPPIWLGAFGAVGVRRVARLDASWAVAPNGDLAEVGNRMALMRSLLAEYGRSPVRDYPLLREGCVAPTRQEAVDAAAPYLAEQYENYRGWKHGASVADMVAGQMVIGSPQDAIERLSAYARMGYTDVVMRLQWSNMPQKDVLRSLRLLGREVLPALAEVEVPEAQVGVDLGEMREELA